MFDNFYKIPSSSNICHTPDQFPRHKKVSYFPTFKNPKNIINKNQNIYNINLNPPFSNLTEKQIDESFSNFSSNNIELLNQKINSQKNRIIFLKSCLGNNDNMQRDISLLNKELNEIKEAIKEKNEIISEYQVLSEKTKRKFEIYINKADKQFNEYKKKDLNIPILQNENKELTQKLLYLLKENKILNQQNQGFEQNDINERNKIISDINNLKINYQNIVKETNNIRNENIKNNQEIENLRKQLILKDNNESELENIKNKCFFLENQITKKDNYIENLSKINEVLKKKLNSSNNNYNKILNKKGNLKEKIQHFENLCNDYELALQKLRKSKSLHPYEFSGLNYFSRNKKNPKQNRIFYKHNNAQKRIELINKNSNKSLMNYNYSNYNLKDIKNKKKKFKNNCLTERNMILNLKTCITDNNIKLSDNNHTFQSLNPNLDKSFGYSNYLLEKLKYKISKINL